MGIFGSIGGLIGAQKMKKASKKADKAAIAAMEKAIAEQNRQFDVTSGYYEPYRAAGETALGGYGDLLGIGGADKQQAAIDQLKGNPFYQSLYRTGEEAILQNASATGGLRGGNTQHSLADFGADTLMKAIEHQMAGLGGLAQMGMGSVQDLGKFGAANSSNVADLMTSQGLTKAAGYNYRGGLTAGQWQGLGGLMDQGASMVAGGFGAPGAGFSMSGAMNSTGGQSLFGQHQW
jgi:hypothetical protein